MPNPLLRLRPLEVGTTARLPDEPKERAASLDPVEFSGLSMSIIGAVSFVALLLLWRRCLLDGMVERGREAAPGPGVLLGGAAAMGTTPLPPTAPVLKPVGVLPAVLPPEPGLSPSRAAFGGVVALVAVVEDIASVEFFREAEPKPAFFFDLVLVPPTGRLAPEPRLRFLITSVFKLRGRTTPWSFRNRPQALHKGCPSGFRRQRGVVWVKQLVHVVGVLPSLLLLPLPLPDAA